MPKKDDTELIEKLTAQNGELLSDLQRTRADFENYRKQTEASLARVAEASEAKTVAKVLPMIDDISRAVATVAELAPVGKTLEKSMKELGLEKIDVAGEFNPELHEAVMTEGEGENEVMEELRAGYKYNGQVIRPAMVKVKKS